MVEILAAESKDAKEILKLQILAYQSEAKLYNDWSLPALTQTLDSLYQEFEDSVILKAIINNQIVGSVRAKVDNDVCKIGRLIVDPEFQKKGIGTALLKHIEQMHENTTSFELFTGSKSVSNIQLYEKNGYVKSHTKDLSESVSLLFLVKPNKNLSYILKITSFYVSS
ncbi:GNAT family N-acetyltransferase [uncultured Thiothrix sp.]|uniref:GNAT family N-acetyltransferase n=1 Tax=uncultured Thiothrix sp. TaxID=223185 RepID=UPI002632DF70|nr:GNAT family N-acetyltransferase [uncultured Thiothrix sp.]HMT93454.1 GNAT family N-acetyltransferase [Thiolinea sp.]